MDLVRMLRNYARAESTGAFAGSIMSEAADRIEKYEKQEEERAKMDLSLDQKLKEDQENAYNAMCQIGANNDIWQNEKVYELAKGVYDIIEKLKREGK